jgi:Major intrinsic protein
VVGSQCGEVRQLQCRTLIWHSVIELFLTCVLLCGVTTIVRFVVGPSRVSRAIPQIHLELIIAGALVGLLLAGLIMSRPGRISGGHMNPAISLGMWRFGVFPGSGVLPYTAAQLSGSVLGVLAARGFWGPVAARPPVSYAVLQPAPLWSAAPLFIAELVGMGVIVFLVGYFLSVPRLAPRVPWLVGGLIGLGIAALGTHTGGQLESCAPVWARHYFRTHSRALGIPPSANGGGLTGSTVTPSVQRRHQVLTYRLCGTRPDGRPLDDRGRDPGPVVNRAA